MAYEIEIGNSMRENLDEEVIFDHSQLGLLNGRPNRKDSSISRASLGDIPSQHGSRKFSNLLRTIAICAAYFALGLCMAVTGPTLPYLQQQVDQTIGAISFIFTARSVGVLLGSVIGGFLLNLCNYYSLLFIATVLTAIGIGAMPWCRHLWILMVSSSLVGIGGGFLDTGANVVCLDLWGRDSGSYMQAMQLTFSLGSTVAPLLVQSFISNTEILGSSHRNPRSVMESFEEPDNAILTTMHNNAINSSSVLKMDLLNVSDKQEREHPDIINPTTTPISITLNSTGSQPTILEITTNRGNITTSRDIEATTIKIPKPKPPFTDGTSLGNSNYFDRPLQNVPPPEIVEEKIPAHTTSGNLSSSQSHEDNSQTTISPFNGTSIGFSAAMNGTVSQNSSQSSSSEMVSEISVKSTTQMPTIQSSEILNSANSTVLTPNSPPANNVTKMAEFNYTRETEIPITRGNQSENQTVTDVVQTESPASTEPVKSTISTTIDNAWILFNSTKNLLKNVTTMSGVDNTTKSLTTAPSTIADNTKNTTASVKKNDDVKDSTHHSLNASLVNAQLTVPVKNFTTVTEMLSTIGTLKPNIGLSVTSEFKQSSESTLTGTSQVTKPNEQTVNKSSTTQKPVYPVTRRIPKPYTYSNDTDDSDSVAVTFEKYGVTRMHMLYTVIAIVVLHVAFCFLFCLCSSTNHIAITTIERITETNNSGHNRFLTGLFFFIFLVYVGTEVSYGQYLATFALNSQLKLSSSAANYITAVFWGSFTISRFLSTSVVNIFNPTFIVLFNFGFCTSASIILSMAGQKTEVILYIGSAMIGIGMASTFATGFHLAEKQTGIVKRMTSSYSIASACGEMIFPVIIGGLMDGNIMSLMYVQLVSNLLCIVIYLATWFFPRTIRCYRTNNEYQLAKQMEDE